MEARIYPVSIKLINNSKDIQLTCKNMYVNEKVMFLYGVNFEELSFTDIASLMLETKYNENFVSINFENILFHGFLKMVDTSAKHIKVEF